MKTASLKNSPLSVSVDDGELVIRIGVNTLAGAVAGGNDFHAYEEDVDGYFRQFAIIDAEGFARDVAREFQREDEAGASPLSNAIDSMAMAAIDDGSENIKYGKAIRFGEKSPLEKW